MSADSQAMAQMLAQRLGAGYNQGGQMAVTPKMAPMTAMQPGADMYQKILLMRALQGPGPAGPPTAVPQAMNAAQMPTVGAINA